MAFATDPRVVAEQAGMVAAAWSGPGTPRSWQLTAAQFEALRDEDLAGVRAWLAACLPQEIGAVTRFRHAAEIARRHPARTVRGDACDLLPGILRDADPDTLVCVVDSYASVFFPPEELKRFRAAIATAGRERDLVWISVDPLVPMGTAATHSVIGLAAPPELVERGHREGVFGVVGRLAYTGGRREGQLLALAHPGAAWLEWLPQHTG